MLGKEKIIFFDFSFSNTISVAIANENKNEIEVQNSVSSEKLYGTKFIAEVVNSAMKISGTAFEDLGKIVLARGPGSFTALRALIAYSQGISFALRIPIYTTLTFRWIALFLEKLFDMKTIRFHLFSGKKNIFYCAEYEFLYEKEEEIEEKNKKGDKDWNSSSNKKNKKRKISKISKERIFLSQGYDLAFSLDVERAIPPEVGAKHIAELYFTQPEMFDFFPPQQIHKIKPEYIIKPEYMV